MMIFQLLLAVGLPLGNMAWGGNHRILPLKLRISSLLSAGLFILAAVVFLQKAKIISVFTWDLGVNILAWFFVLLFGLSILGNLKSNSGLEKKIMTPVAITLTVLCLILTLEI
jgi:hypothetical protein